MIHTHILIVSIVYYVYIIYFCKISNRRYTRHSVVEIWHESRPVVQLYRFYSKIPDQRVYHYEPGRLMFPRSLQQTFISLCMIYGIR